MDEEPNYEFNYSEDEGDVEMHGEGALSFSEKDEANMDFNFSHTEEPQSLPVHTTAKRLPTMLLSALYRYLPRELKESLEKTTDPWGRVINDIDWGLRFEVDKELYRRCEDIANREETISDVSRFFSVCTVLILLTSTGLHLSSDRAKAKKQEPQGKPQRRHKGND